MVIIKGVFRFARKVLDKKSLIRIKSIETEAERIRALEYSFKCKFEEILDDFDKKIKMLKKEKKNTFFADIKLSLLRSKIKLFHATLHKKDFNNILSLIKETKKELENV